MKSVQETYLGWEQPRHHRGCTQTGFAVDYRVNDDVPRYGGGFGEEKPAHRCKDEHCGHRNSFAEMVVRIVCRSCGVAEVITGEKTPDTGHGSTSTKSLGYGLLARRVSGLLLWPGDPWLSIGRADSPEPHDFLVTRPGVKQVTEPDVVGQITQGRGQRGGVMWAANAVAAKDGQYGVLGRVKWAHARDDLKTPTAAAKWIAATLVETSIPAGGTA
ncbi:hypothetical protein [Streptomyces sp. NPDC050535]|uniref:hypothetical protein n=1 Tax=Streptomyces sp. NPDC050535 TaxID=3365626 RepID=UPI0037B7E9C6